jgi:hypothetical protein
MRQENSASLYLDEAISDGQDSEQIAEETRNAASGDVEEREVFAEEMSDEESPIAVSQSAIPNHISQFQELTETETAENETAANSDSNTNENPTTLNAARSEMRVAALRYYQSGYSQKYARKKLTDLGCLESDVDWAAETAWAEYVATQRAEGWNQLQIGLFFLLVGVAVATFAALTEFYDPEIIIGAVVSIPAGLWFLFRGGLRVIGGR